MNFEIFRTLPQEKELKERFPSGVATIEIPKELLGNSHGPWAISISVDNALWADFAYKTYEVSTEVDKLIAVVDGADLWAVINNQAYVSDSWRLDEAATGTSVIVMVGGEGRRIDLCCRVFNLGVQPDPRAFLRPSSAAYDISLVN